MICLLLTILITWHPQPCDSFGVYAVADSVTLIGTTADTCYRFDAGAVGWWETDMGAGLNPASPSRHYEVADHHGDIAGGRISPAVKGPEIPPIRRFFYVTAFLDTRESAPSEQVSALLLDWDQGADITCRVKRWRSVKRQHMLRITLPGQAESWCVYWTHDNDSVTAVCEFEVTGDGWIGLSDLGVLREDLQHLSTFCRFADVYQKQGVIEYGIK